MKKINKNENDDYQVIYFRGPYEFRTIVLIVLKNKFLNGKNTDKKF